MRRLAGPALVALACALAAAGCGGQPAEAEPFGVALQVADCQDWRDSSPQERQSAIDQLERTVKGPRNEATALDDDEANKILQQMEAEPSRIRMTLTVGQAVRIIDGPFTDFTGTVDEIDQAKGKVKVLVSFFGRETPVELDFLQVEKNL